MKRKDFIKGCFVLGGISLIPKMGEGKLMHPVYGHGYQQKNGLCYGFWHEENGEIELVTLDYQRIPYDQKKVSNPTKRFAKLNDSLEKRKIACGNTELTIRLDKSLRQKIDAKLLGEKSHTKKEMKIINSRMKKWAKWFYKRKP